MVTESELRLECLRLAASLPIPANILEQAEAFYKFISGGLAAHGLWDVSAAPSQAEDTGHRS